MRPAPKSFQRDRAWLREAAVGAIVLGALFLTVPALVNEPALQSSLDVLRMPGAVALAVGVAGVWLRAWFDRAGSREVTRADSPAGPQMPWVGPREGEGEALSSVATEGAPAAAVGALAAACPPPEQEDPGRFVASCRSLFEQAGLEACVQPPAIPGRTDIRLHSRHAPGAPVKIAHCWASPTDLVTLADVQALWLDMTASRVASGILATPSTVAPDARGFAADRRIQLLDSGAVHRLIRERESARSRG